MENAMANVSVTWVKAVKVKVTAYSRGSVPFVEGAERLLSPPETLSWKHS